MELEVLTSQARRRLALKTSAMAVLGAGIFGAIPVMAAVAQPAPVAYTCNNETITFTMELKTPTTARPSAPVTVIWDIKQPASGYLSPTAEITPNSSVVAQGTISPSGSPIPSSQVVASASVAPATTISETAPLPIPTMTMVVTPTASGTVALKGGGFAVEVNEGQTYNCTPPTNGGPSVNLVVGTPTATPTKSPTPT
ncbi:hypothetical protein E1295_23625, partial [Nonomuraea mesophila]